MNGASAVLAIALLLPGCAGESSGGSVLDNHPTTGTLRRSLDRTYVIFADVTRSLTPLEQASVAERVRGTIDLLPPKATLAVFPVLEDVERAPALFTGKLPEIQSTSDSVDFSMAKAAWKKNVIDRLTAIQNGPPIGRGRTCLSGALRKAQQFTIDATPSRPVEIVIVSDMLEDCDDSLLGRKLSLEKPSIDAELKLLSALPPEPLLRLNGASVTVLLPTVPTTLAATRRPPVHQLQAFWRGILDHSGDQKENFRFGTEIPERLRALNIEEKGGL